MIAYVIVFLSCMLVSSAIAGISVFLAAWMPIWAAVIVSGTTIMFGVSLL